MADKEQPKLPDAINITFKEGPDYRLIRADGAWAGLTPQLEIQFALFNDLQPMPKTVRHHVAPDGSLGPEFEREADLGIRREVSAMVVMNPVTAMQFVRLLQAMLGQIADQLKVKNIQVEPLMTQLENAAKTGELK